MKVFNEVKRVIQIVETFVEVLKYNKGYATKVLHDTNYLELEVNGVTVTINDLFVEDTEAFLFISKGELCDEFTVDYLLDLDEKDLTYSELYGSIKAIELEG